MKLKAKSYKLRNKISIQKIYRKYCLKEILRLKKQIYFEDTKIVKYRKLAK